MTFTFGYDVTGSMLDSAPQGVQLASYVTEASPGDGIAMTAAQLAAHPGIIRISQQPSLSADEQGYPDVLDYESLAATLSDVAPWAADMQAAFKAGKRPGQREPSVYQSANNVTPVVNALIAGGVTSGVGLWVANWNFTEAQAIADVLNASGPFPIIGVQFKGGPLDTDIWSAQWLANVSMAPGTIPAPVNLSQTSHVGVTTNFSWGSSQPKAQHHFEVAEAGVLVPVVDELITGTHAMGVVLKPGTDYSWRVSVAGPAGLWSPWKRFVTSS